MLFQHEPIAAMAAGCCSPLQYLEGAAYIAIVLAVLGVPQLLTYYLDQRNRRNDRREDQAEAERIRREERAETERVRKEDRAETERVRKEDRAETERVRKEDRAEAERARREERAEGERRHQETLAALMGAITAMTALIERNGHTPPEQSAVVQELQRRIDLLETENARLRAGNEGNSFDAGGATGQDF